MLTFSDSELEQLIPIIRNNLKLGPFPQEPWEEETFKFYKDGSSNWFYTMNDILSSVTKQNRKHEGDKALIDLLESPLEDMPLFINHEYLKPYAIWRIKINK
jgi:hypothetical protein